MATLRMRGALLILGLTLALSLPAAAQMGGKMFGMPGEKGAMPGAQCPKWPKEPEWLSTMTPEQRARMDGMHLALKKEMSLLEGKAGLRESELKNLVTTEAPDKKEVHRLIDEIIALKKEMMMKKYDHVMELRGILTPEQRKSFDMMFLGGMHLMGGGMMGGGMGHDMGGMGR